jgi:hypothetical protein
VPAHRSFDREWRTSRAGREHQVRRWMVHRKRLTIVVRMDGRPQSVRTSLETGCRTEAGTEPLVGEVVEVRVRMLAAIGCVLLIAAAFSAGRPLAATSPLHATWSCGSVLAPKRFGFPPFGKAPREFQLRIAAGQAACAEERDVVGARVLVLSLVGGSFALTAWGLARKQPADDAIDARA